MIESDSLQRFLFEHASIRGEIIHLEQSYQTILSQHAYPEAVKHLLGEALMSAALLAGSLQFEGQLSIQFHGDKRLPLLLVQCDHQLHLRGFAKFEESTESIDYNAAFLEGKMELIINQYNQTQAYQSIVPIESLSMAENLSNYFSQSEQISTRVWFVTSKYRAAGMLLQLMPGQDVPEREQFWEYAVKIGETITDNELLSLDNETILHRLYHETELRLYPARHPTFRCQCSIEKMKQVLTVLGKEDMLQLLTEKDKVEVNCEFCNQNYAFDSIDVEMVFRGASKTDIWVKKVDE